ncbi:TonB-dependent receptor [Flavitalea sp. BT771]|uniref:TonB-dependent receptor n=1 Tax=Flavitalea sp. BT771 TaxID=3063329 RepID=UPI0026E19825|nr:TonB-dependent receptor [Flavitalea sp. BT771]MDO6434953.1 TonB-dependent receptor [Flavitalea sp. BT771]MDV6223853.1 TonB-dependent receptor [Flavitalea sp. BT771]
MKYLFPLLLLLSGAMAAQSQTVVLRGSVVDRQTGEPLQGATVEIEGRDGSGTRGGARLVAGLDGTFVLRDLRAGDYKIRVNAIGYGKYEADVVVREGGSTMRIDMERRQTELEMMQVSGRHDRGSERASLLADRRADIVQNSLSARSIEISPDLSVANTAQRISGVSLERSSNGEGQYVIIRGMDKRYIYTLVNGIKIPSPDNKNRYVPLDIFPADMLDRLEVIKSLTPNMESDAIGGAVNMIMKDAPARFSVNANVAAGYASKFFTQDYTHFSSGPSLDLSPRQINGPSYVATMKDFPDNAFSHDTRHHPLALLGGLSMGGRVWHDKLGILIGASYQNNYRNVNSVFFNTEMASNGATKVTGIEDRKYSIQQQRSGVHAKLDLTPDARNKISLYGAWLNLMRNEFRMASDTNLQLGRVGPGFGRINNTYRTLHDVQQMVNATLKGEHQIGDRLKLDWTGAYSKATLNRPDEGVLNVSTGVSKDSTGHAVHAPSTLFESDRIFAHSSDEDKSGYAHLTYRTRIGGVRTDWLAGGMYRSKKRTSTYDDYELRPASPSNQQYDGDIRHNHFEVFNGQGTFSDALNYTAKENVGAAYLMLKLDWHNFLITGGTRIENTDLSWASNLPETAEGKTGSVTYYDVLPSGNIKYSLNARQALRLSYYSAISRPNFYEIIPHVSNDADADYDEKGNPNLKHTVSDNLDLRYELYPKGLDQFVAGVFYKRLKNPIEYALVNEGTFVYYEAYNFGNATNYGLEADMTKFWRWFGIKANYTYTHSSITTTKQQNYLITGGSTNRMMDQTRPLQGQSKHIANLSLLFKDDGRAGLNAQLAFGYTSARINTVSQFLDNDIWQKGFAQMDFSAEKRVTRRWYVYAKVNNILNTPFQLEIRQPYTGVDVVGDVKYQTPGKNTFVRKDTYGTNYLLGVKFKF